MSKTTYKYVCKYDDDCMHFPDTFKKRLPELKKIGDNKFSIGVRGINLFDHNEQLYVNKKNLFTAGGDPTLFKYNDSCRFIQLESYERFRSNLTIHHINVDYYHLKMCKKDRGQNNYNLNDNDKSRYLNIFKSIMEGLDLIPLNKYIHKKYIHPYLLGFKYINNSEKKYQYEEFNDIEKQLLQNTQIVKYFCYGK